MTNQTIENVKAYLLENMDEVRSITFDLYGNDEQIYENDEEFFDIFFKGKPSEAVRAAHYGDYNYMDTYVRFNGYGNLESLNEYQLEKEIKESIDEIIEQLIENRLYVSISPELEKLLNEETEE